MAAKISIITPVYNSEKYLKDCINSVLNQSFTDFEFVLVNDGSTDRSGVICDAFAKNDKRIKVIHKENEGPTNARKQGARESDGEYITFLDSDDLLKPDLLEKIMDYIAQYNPDAIIFGHERFGEGIENNELTIPLMNEGLYSEDTLKEVRDNLIYSNQDILALQYGVWGKIFRRDDYIKYQDKVIKELYKGEDLAVNAPLLANCKSVYISHICGYLYRDTPGSIMNSFKDDEPKQMLILADYLSEALDENYRRKIGVYVVTHIFDYLDRAILNVKSYSDYIKIAKVFSTKEFKKYLKSTKSHTSDIKDRIVFFLAKYRLYFLIWVLRKVVKRREG